MGNMRRVVVTLITVALLSASPSLALAQEGAKYNFASAQGGKQISVIPGGEGEGVLYFYNIDGNRITHVILEVSEAPASWKVEIQPPQHEIQVEISGQLVTVTENLHVNPSELLSQETEDVPEDMECIIIPGRGYALAQPAHIIVRVPDGEEIGTNGNILISAEAEWLGQGGAATIKQARDFEFSVEVISAETDFTETIVGESDSPRVNGPTIPTTTNESNTPGSSTMNWLPAIIAGVIVILGAALIPRLVAKKRR